MKKEPAPAETTGMTGGGVTATAGLGTFEGKDGRGRATGTVGFGREMGALPEACLAVAAGRTAGALGCIRIVGAGGWGATLGCGS